MLKKPADQRLDSETLLDELKEKYSTWTHKKFFWFFKYSLID